jgi:hypothetical protein
MFINVFLPEPFREVETNLIEIGISGLSEGEFLASRRPGQTHCQNE